MATATFYLNTSDDRRLDKKLTQLSTATISYKDDTSVVNPTIKVSIFENLFKANYVYLSDFGRYYFIREITTSQQFVYFVLEEDVRYTLRNQIRNCNAIIKRQEKLCNYYLDDEKFKAREYSRIQTKTFAHGFTQNAFLLTIAGGR